MSGAIIHSPTMPSWCGAQLKHRDNFTFTFRRIRIIMIIRRESGQPLKKVLEGKNRKAETGHLLASIRDDDDDDDVSSK
jgi:hypothetical protein